MTLTQIIASKDFTPDEKLQAISDIVVKARAAYGNTEATITPNEVHTVNGLEDMIMLSSESKLAIAESEIQNIKTTAVEFTKAFDGAILDKKIEELIAISPILSNLTTTLDSNYL